MKKTVILIASTFIVNGTFAQPSNVEPGYSIPPQYVCVAKDATGEEFAGSSDDGESIKMRAFSDTGNLQMVVEAAESAMKKCVNKSSDLKSCDIIDCKENPQ